MSSFTTSDNSYRRRTPDYSVIHRSMFRDQKHHKLSTKPHAGNETSATDKYDDLRGLQTIPTRSGNRSRPHDAHTHVTGLDMDT
ncbi:hypothetical protein EGX38_06370 [Cutibacterium acnes]|nr:hypothetical protein EGX38_06370 [Cutibacterium acnes]PGF44363.1 hypothetical protein B1C73_09750 [Cutibacterium acnes subsp. acnes]RHW00305.1 hypothetical protein DXA85_09520 [Propionibacterium sp. KPL2009]